MKRRLFILALSMASLGFLVNPAFSDSPTLDRLVDRAVTEGEDSLLPAAAAEPTLGLPKKDFDVKQFEAPKGDCADSKYRLFSVLVDKDGSKLGNLWFFVRYQWPGNSETHNFLSTVEGELLKASRVRGKRNQDGNVIEGSGSLVDLDIDSAEVKAKFKKELDFWVKGKGRKKNKAATKPDGKEKEDRSAATRG